MLFSLSMLRQALHVRAENDVVDAPGDAKSEAASRVERMVRQHTDSVWRTARDLGVPSRDLEDVTQEVLLVVLRRLADIEVTKERAFMLATTVRVAANWRRTRQRRPEELTESMDILPNANAYHASVTPTPEEALERTQRLALLRAALAQMPEPQRVAFTLFELEQLTAKEIAEQLELAEGAVFSRVRRAWQVFRRVCGQYGALTGPAGSKPEGRDD